MPSPQAQCHLALWLSKSALNFGGEMSHKKTNLPFLVEEGVLVPGSGLETSGFSLFVPYALKTENFLLSSFTCPNIPSSFFVPTLSQDQL